MILLLIMLPIQHLKKSNTKQRTSIKKGKKQMNAKLDQKGGDTTVLKDTVVGKWEN